MALNQGSPAALFEDMLRHVGHRLQCVTYGGTGKAARNVAIECVRCGEVLLDQDCPEPGRKRIRRLVRRG